MKHSLSHIPHRFGLPSSDHQRRRQRSAELGHRVTIDGKDLGDVKSGAGADVRPQAQEDGYLADELLDSEELREGRDDVAENGCCWVTGEERTVDR